MPLPEGGANAQPELDASVAARDATVDLDAQTVGTDAGPRPFALVQRSPQGELQDLGASIVLTFSDSVDPKWVTSDSLRVLRNGAIVEGVLSVSQSTIYFTPKRAWAVGASYEVQLGAQLQDRRASALTPSRLTFKVRKGAWSVTRPSFADPPYRGVQVATNADGRAALVLHRTEPPANASGTLLGSLEAATAWRTPVPVCATLYAELGDQRIRVSAEGRAVIACGDGPGSIAAAVVNGTGGVDKVEQPATSYTPTYYNARVAIANDNTGLQLINRYGDGVPSHPVLMHFYLSGFRATATQVVDVGESKALAVLPQGALVVWYQRVAVPAQAATWRGEVWATIVADDGTCVPQGGQCSRRLSLQDTGAEYPRVATDPNGNAIVVWEQGSSVMFATYSPAGAWSGAEAVPTGESVFPGMPNVGMDGDGNAVVAFLRSDATRTFDLAVARLAHGATSWSEPELLAHDVDPLVPQLAVAPGGEVVLAWVALGAAVDGGGRTSSIGVAYAEPGQAWVPAPADEHDLGAGGASVAIDASGRALAAWISAGEVFVRRYL
jgi:hypothetical protein